MTKFTVYGLDFEAADFDGFMGDERAKSAAIDALEYSLRGLSALDVTALHRGVIAGDEAALDRADSLAARAVRAATQDWGCWGEPDHAIARPFMALVAL